MSSGAYYEMRRKATREGTGITKEAFDKAARNLSGYKRIKETFQAKRDVLTATDRQRAVNRIKDAIDALGPDIEIGWGTA